MGVAVRVVKLSSRGSSGETTVVVAGGRCRGASRCCRIVTITIKTARGGRICTAGALSPTGGVLLKLRRRSSYAQQQLLLLPPHHRVTGCC